MKDSKDCKSKCGKASICNLGSALGLAWGLNLLVIALLSMCCGLGSPIVKMFTSLYVGYHASLLGSLIGLLWGFVHGFVTGGLLAAVYNFCSCCCPCKSCKKDRCSM